MVERRREQQDQRRRRAGPGARRRRPSPGRARAGIGGAREDAPRLRDRVDPALGVGRGAERGAVVEEGAAVPVAVPAVALERGSERLRAGPRSAPLGTLAPGVRDRRNGGQDGVQEPAEPDALARPPAPTRFMPSFQSPDPMSGSPCAPTSRLRSTAARSGRTATPAPAPGPAGSRRRAGPARERRSLEVRDHLVEDGCVAGHLDVARNHVRQPEAVVRDPRPHAAAGRRVPPVLDVPLDELAAPRPAAGAPAPARARATRRARTSCSWSRKP